MSTTTTTTTSEAFGGGSSSMQIKPPIQTQPPPQQPSVRLAYTTDGTAIYQPVNANPNPPLPATSYQPAATALPPPASSPHGLSINTGESVKRKRGRPRKYGPDSSMSVHPALGGGGNLVSPPAASTPPGFSGGTPAPVVQAASGDGVKKARGRPPGSANKKKQHQMAALGGSRGIGFTPHIITVKAGEDVSSKVMSFTQNGSRAVCILSANGAISNVTLRQPATSGGTRTYEGRFEILSLSGSFLLSENGGQRSRTGGLSVSLASPDGHVLGGGVAGLLTAASPVQIVLGSFIADGKKEPKQFNLSDSASALGKVAPVGMAGASSSPPSRGTLSESSGGPGSPPNQSGTYNNSNQLGGLASFPWK